MSDCINISMEADLLNHFHGEVMSFGHHQTQINDT